MKQNNNRQKTYTKILSPLVASWFALVASGIANAEVVCNDEEETLCAALIRKGEPSPLEGQVLTSSLAINLAQRAYGCEKRLKLELTKLSETYEAQLDEQRKIYKSELKALETEKDLYKKQALVKVPWYETPLFVAGVTTVVLTSIFGAFIR